MVSLDQLTLQSYSLLFETHSSKLLGIDVSLALETRLKFAYSFSAFPSVLPSVISGWIGATIHVTPLSAGLLLTRVQDGKPLLAAGRAGLPTLVIQATQDVYIVLDQVEKELKMFSDMTVKTIEGGHIIFYDAFRETVEAVLAFAGRYTVRFFMFFLLVEMLSKDLAVIRQQNSVYFHAAIDY